MVLGTALPNVRHKGGEKVIIGCAKEMNKHGRTQEVGHPTRRPIILPTQRRLTKTMYRYPECRRGTLESQDLVQHKSSILDVRGSAMCAVCMYELNLILLSF